MDTRLHSPRWSDAVRMFTLLALAGGTVAWTAFPASARSLGSSTATEIGQPEEEGGGRRRRPAPAEAPAADAKPAEGAADATTAESAPPVGAPAPGDTDPLGFAGESFDLPQRVLLPKESIASPDRWRIGWPSWDRYGRHAKSDPIFMNANGGDSPYTLGSPWNPYDRSILKGDYPIFGNNWFFNFTGVSDTFFQYRKNPIPSGASAQFPGSFDTFRDGKSFVVNQNFFLNFDLIKGYTSYRPIDLLIRVTPAFNINYAEIRERGGLNVDPGFGTTRTDNFTTLQEAFAEIHLGDLSEWFDILSVKAGRQLFLSDFRGFVFNDITDGVRLTANYEANRIQANLAFFNQTEKDTNSGLSELDWRDQQVLVANVFVQDFIWLGYTVSGSFHWNHDSSNERYDTNGFLVRPDPVGNVQLRDLDAYYLGFAGDGHIGRLNINHAFYYAFGEDENNPIAGRPVDISAFLGAIELSYDLDWLRPKISFLYASGDNDAADDKAEGFDGIFDDPNFAGGPGSFYQNQGLRVFGVGLNQGRSFYNSLKSSKIEGQSNFVNPGVMVFNLGLDTEVTPKIRASTNANYIWLENPRSLEFLLNQTGISDRLGVEVNQTVQWRPFLNNNIIFTAGASVFFPQTGFNDIYGDNKTLWQVFTGLTLTY